MADKRPQPANQRQNGYLPRGKNTTHVHDLAEARSKLYVLRDRDWARVWGLNLTFDEARVAKEKIAGARRSKTVRAEEMPVAEDLLAICKFAADNGEVEFGSWIDPSDAGAVVDRATEPADLSLEIDRAATAAVAEVHARAGAVIDSKDAEIAKLRQQLAEGGAKYRASEAAKKAAELEVLRAKAKAAQAEAELEAAKKAAITPDPELTDAELAEAAALEDADLSDLTAGFDIANDASPPATA